MDTPTIMKEPLEEVDGKGPRSEEHTSELQSRLHLVCRLLLEKKKKKEEQVSFQELTPKEHCNER